VNHCVLAGNAYHKAVEIAQEITKQVHYSADIIHKAGLIISRSLHYLVIKFFGNSLSRSCRATKTHANACYIKLVAM